MAIDPDWLVPDWRAAGVGALMTTRRGGCSAAPFATMNLHDGLGDAAAAVARNRLRLAEAMPARPVFLKQVHGTEVVRLDAADARTGEPVRVADASITTEPGVACTVLVADCLPVLFAAPQGRAVGAAHAGWRGLSAGVLDATVRAVCEAAGCAPDDLQAWLGAAIGPSRFQVGADVLNAFGVDPSQCREGAAETGRAQPEGAALAFAAERPGKWLANLPLLAAIALRASGVGAIAGGGWCTVSDPSRFFSFRRDGVTGRMAAAIWIEPR